MKRSAAKSERGQINLRILREDEERLDEQSLAAQGAHRRGRTSRRVTGA
jgi:hypothetical protein